MVKLTVVKAGRPPINGSLAAHRASATEGEAAKRLLESQGFTMKRKANGQFEFPCPFHEGPGTLERGKAANFYMNASTSEYFCQSASCGERGNLQLLERFFGIDQDDDFIVRYRDRDTRLKEFERNLTAHLRTPFYEHGLSDATIERFRLGYQVEHDEEYVDEQGQKKTRHIPARYVIPYLEGRRPRFFRYYNPTGDPKWKYTWEQDAESTLFNAQDAIGDKDGVVYLCEGEQKAMLLVQMGYAAVAVPGAGQWKDEFQAAFTHAKKVIVCFDNDNPAFHNYDKPEKAQVCRKCAGQNLDRCRGHNPGQEAALKRVDQIGWRAKNILLPWPNDEVKKTDINDYFVRDGHSNADFAELATGKRATPYKVMSLAEITEKPPEEAEFLIENGILSKGGRLLVAGKPKVGKSIFIDNLALALASGIPFLKSGTCQGFAVDHPTRTLLLDRELSKWALFKRLHALMDDRPGYKAAMENMLIDHDHLIRLDQPNAYDTLLGLVEQNGAEVVILDTAYKFFGGDIESSSSISKGFEVLDKVIHQTGCSFVLTHHHKKGQGGNGSKQNTDIADPDNVAGSFLWTGWPNGTILLNYLNRSVENPFNSIATFTAFRDAAPPEPLALYRNRESISYSSIEHYSHQDDSASSVAGSRNVQVIKPDTDAVEDLLLEFQPVTEDEFLLKAASKFGVSVQTIKPYFVDAMARGNFERVKGDRHSPAILKYKHEPDPEPSWEADHGLPERPLPEGSGLSLEDVDMFDAAGITVQ